MTAIPSYPLTSDTIRVHSLHDYLGRAGTAATHSHRHGFWQCVYFSKGTGTHHVDLMAYEFRAGMLLMLPEGAIHRFTEVPHTGIMLHFPATLFIRGPEDASRLLRLRAVALESPFATPPEEDQQMLAQLLAQLQQETARGLADSSMQQALLHTLVLLYMRWVDGPLEREAYLSFAELVEAHYTEHFSVLEYARTLQISDKRLYALCDKAVGKSPGRVIEERLVLEAKRRLIHSQESISNIAFVLGFIDPAYFSRFFKKRVGSTPRQFRTQGSRKNN